MVGKLSNYQYRRPKAEHNVLLDELYTVVETANSVKQLSGIARGNDAIPGDVY